MAMVALGQVSGRVSSGAGDGLRDAVAIAVALVAAVATFTIAAGVMAFLALRRPHAVEATATEITPAAA
jgi:hypothetical protein